MHLRICLEVCKFLNAQDLLLSVASVSKLWQIAGTHNEVWSPLSVFYFSELAFTGADSYLSKFKTHVLNTFLPVIHSGKLFKCYYSGRIETIDLNSHTWWTHSVIWSLVLLPDCNIFICLPESSSVAILDKVTGLELQGLPCMSVERMYPGICLCNQSVYVFGGSECDVGYFNPMNTCEKFDLSLKLWKKLPNMKKVCNGCTPAVHNGKIFIAFSGYLEVLDSHMDEFLPEIIKCSWAEEGPAFCWLGRIVIGLGGIGCGYSIVH